MIYLLLSRLDRMASARVKLERTALPVTAPRQLLVSVVALARRLERRELVPNEIGADEDAEALRRCGRDVVETRSRYGRDFTRVTS